MQIGNVQAGTVNAVEGTQNIGTQGGGSVVLSAGEQADLQAGMAEIFAALGNLNDYLNHDAAAPPNGLRGRAIQAQTDGAQTKSAVARSGGIISEPVKAQAGAYLELAEAVFRAAGQAFNDAQPFIEKAMPAIGVVKRILGINIKE